MNIAHLLNDEPVSQAPTPKPAPLARNHGLPPLTTLLPRPAVHAQTLPLRSPASATATYNRDRLSVPVSPINTRMPTYPRVVIPRRKTTYQPKTPKTQRRASIQPYETRRPLVSPIGPPRHDFMVLKGYAPNVQYSQSHVNVNMNGNAVKQRSPMSPVSAKPVMWQNGKANNNVIM